VNYKIGGACSEYGGGWGRGETCTVFWWGNLRERDHCGDPGIDGKIILSCIFRKWDVGYGLDWIGPR